MAGEREDWKGDQPERDWRVDAQRTAGTFLEQERLRQEACGPALAALMKCFKNKANPAFGCMEQFQAYDACQASYDSKFRPAQTSREEFWRPALEEFAVQAEKLQWRMEDAWNWVQGWLGNQGREPPK